MFNYPKNESKDRQGSLKRIFILVYLTYVKKKNKNRAQTLLNWQRITSPYLAYNSTTDYKVSFDH